jgi:uncharacterized Rmd1/YagE family protein
MWKNRPRQRTIFFSAMDAVVKLTTASGLAKNVVVTVFNDGVEETFEYATFQEFQADLEKFHGKTFKVESSVDVEKLAKRVQQILGPD